MNHQSQEHPRGLGRIDESAWRWCHVRPCHRLLKARRKRCNQSRLFLLPVRPRSTWHVSSLIDADAPREQKTRECNEHFIPKYGEIKTHDRFEARRDEVGGGGGGLLISKPAVIPPPPPFSLPDRAFPRRLGSNCRNALCGNC